MAIGTGVPNRVRPTSRRAAAASASSHRRVDATSAGCSGNRAARPAPIRKIAFTVPCDATALTGRSCHRGNCTPTSSRTASVETAELTGVHLHARQPAVAPT